MTTRSISKCSRSRFVLLIQESYWYPMRNAVTMSRERGFIRPPRPRRHAGVPVGLTLYHLYIRSHSSVPRGIIFISGSEDHHQVYSVASFLVIVKCKILLRPSAATFFIFSDAFGQGSFVRVYSSGRLIFVWKNPQRTPGFGNNTYSFITSSVRCPTAQRLQNRERNDAIF